MAYVGMVKKWYNEKGFGFITGPDGVDVFAHHTDLSGQELMEGGKVQYDVTLAEGKPKAINVSGALQPRTSRVGGDQRNDPRDIDPLVRYIKMQQRSCPVYKELWQEFCDKHGGGVLDPARHRYQFLVAAIDECQRMYDARGGGGNGNGGGGGGGGKRGFQHLYEHPSQLQHHQGGGMQFQHHQHHQQVQYPPQQQYQGMDLGYGVQGMQLFNSGNAPLGYGQRPQGPQNGRYPGPYM